MENNLWIEIVVGEWINGKLLNPRLILQGNEERHLNSGWREFQLKCNRVQFPVEAVETYVSTFIDGELTNRHLLERTYRDDGSW